MSLRTLRAQRAFTLVEMLVVVVILGVVLTLVAPSFQQMILMQRLSGINSQLITDLQFARSEAATRNAFTRVTFRSNAAMSCYSIYTYPSNSNRCDCRLTPACPVVPGLVEVRTVRVPVDSKVSVVPGLLSSGLLSPIEFAFDPIAGGLWRTPTDSESTSLAEYSVSASVNSNLKLLTELKRSGRPSVCAPAGSVMRAAACS